MEKGKRPNPERTRMRRFRSLEVKLNGKRYSVAIAGKNTKVYYKTGDQFGPGTLRRVRDWAEIRAVLAEAERKLK